MCACSVTQLCPVLCGPMDCSLPDSSVHGIFLVKILEWVAICSSRGSSRPKDKKPASLASPVLAGGFFTTALPGDPITKDTRNQINPFLFQSFCCPPWFCCAALNPSLFPMNPLCAFEPIALNSVSRQSALCTQISPVRFYQNPVWMQCHPWSFFQFLLQSLFYFWTFSSSSFR